LIELVKRIQIIKLHRQENPIDPRDDTAYVIQTKEGRMGKLQNAQSNGVRGSILPEFGFETIPFFSAWGGVICQIVKAKKKERANADQIPILSIL
jgi:hypothetical protein